MDLIEKTLTDLLGPLGPIYAIGGLGLLLVLLTLPALLNKQEDPLDKLRKSAKAAPSENQARLRTAAHNEKLDKYASFLEPKNEKEYSAVRLKLVQAGYHTRDAVRYYHFSQMALAVLGLVGGLAYFYLKFGADGASAKQMMMYIAGPGGIGYMLPKYWVTRRVAARKEEIENGFPDSLDMMLVCVEAGQSLDQSIVRVAAELRASYPALAEEFQIVAYEMKAGKDKVTVLNDMAERCGVQDVSSFVTVLIQSASFGTSIADALRVYAAEMRDKRVMRAEEKANKLPTKMTLATMMLTVPPLLIILVGPSVNGIQQLGNMGAQ